MLLKREEKRGGSGDSRWSEIGFEDVRCRYHGGRLAVALGSPGWLVVAH